MLTTRSRRTARYFAIGIPAVLGSLLAIEQFRGFGVAEVVGAAVVVLVGLVGCVSSYAVIESGGRPRYVAAGLAAFGAAILVGLLLPALPDWQGGAVWPAGAIWVVVWIVYQAITVAGSVADGVVIGASILLALIPSLPVDTDEPYDPVFLVATVVALAVAVAVGLRMRASHARVTHAVASTRESERARMAMELHDVIAHEVAGIAVLAQAGQMAGAADTEILGKIEGSARRALTDIRAMVQTLRDPAEMDRPITAPGGADSGSIPRLVDEFDSTTECSVDKTIDEHALALASDTVRLVVHRVLAESLTNIRRHASTASSVSIDIGPDGAVSASSLVVRVHNSSSARVGHDTRLAGSGSGLAGIRERLATVGGSLEAGPDADGWTVTASIPQATAPDALQPRGVGTSRDDVGRGERR